MSKRELTILSSEEGDWHGFYIDGKLQCEGHSLHINQVLEALGYEVKDIEKSMEWFEKYGCPKELPDDA